MSIDMVPLRAPRRLWSFVELHHFLWCGVEYLATSSAECWPRLWLFYHGHCIRSGQWLLSPDKLPSRKAWSGFTGVCSMMYSNTALVATITMFWPDASPIGNSNTKSKHGYLRCWYWCPVEFAVRRYWFAKALVLIVAIHLYATNCPASTNPLGMRNQASMLRLHCWATLHCTTTSRDNLEPRL